MACIEITDITNTLADAFSLDQVNDWLDKPHPLLAGKTPSAVIAEGRQADVQDVAAREVAHENMDWMDWKNGKAMIQDEGAYEAEMVDGTSRRVVAEVYGADEGSLRPADDEPDFDDSAVSRIRWLGV